MDKDMKDFLSVLRRSIHGRNSEPFPVDAAPEKLVQIAKLHKVLPLIVQSEKDTEEFSSHRIFAPASKEALSSAVAQIKRTESFKFLYCKMNENGIFPLVMKGIVCRGLYGEKGDYRASSDEDILIKKEDFESIDKFLRNEGFQPDKDNLTEKEKDFIQEVTYTSQNTDLRLEVHLNLFGKDDLFRRKMNEFFEDVHDFFREEKSGDVSIRTMNHTKHFLVLVLHALKHLTVSGFGIRMVCDILLYMEKYYEEIDFDYIIASLREVNGESFLADLIFIGNEYLGFSLPETGEMNCPEELLEDILESGIYGNYTQARRTSVHMVHSAFAERSTSSKFGKAGLLFDAIFPPKERLRELCPEVERKPWLIFDVYIKRMGRFIAHNRQSGNNLAAESIKIGQKRIALLKKYKLL